MTAAWPAVAAGIVTFASDAIAPTRVVRGRDVSQESGDVVMVGMDLSGFEALVSSAGLVGSAAGTFTQTMQTFGGNREEVGEVNGLILARNGDSDQDAATSTACGYLAAIEIAVRADPTLGLTGFDYVVAEMQFGDVAESQSDDGATAFVSFVITYKIRI